MKQSDELARSERARARAAWPGAVLRLEELPEVDVLDGSPEELVAMVRALTLSSWAMSGVPVPTYARGAMPGRVVRGRQHDG